MKNKYLNKYIGTYNSFNTGIGTYIIITELDT